LAEAQHLSHTSSWAWDVRRREWRIGRPKYITYLGSIRKRALLPLQAFRDRILPEDRRRNVEAASQAIREKADFEVDFRVGLPDGSIKRIHSVGHPVVGSDGDVIELIGTHVDVTEQHAAKERLQKLLTKSEIRRSPSTVIDTIPTLVWRAGPEGNPDFLINQPSTTPASRWTKPRLAASHFHPDDMASMLENARNTDVRYARRA